VSNSQYAKGVIISQDPVPGTKIKADGTISVIVSSGSQQATVPNVVGLAIPQALSRLKNAGLKPVLKDTLRTDQMEANHVLKIWPSGGLTLSPGSSVYITVSAANAIEEAPAEPSDSPEMPE
jgi:serine/threonine-protein kinase